MVSFTAGPNEEGMRLSRFVVHNTWRLPNSLLYKSFRNKRVKVNGRPAKPEDRLRPGDFVELYLNDEFFPPGDASPASVPAKILRPDQWSILLEEDVLTVLYKAGGVLSHSDHSGKPSLLGSYTQSLADRGLYSPAGSNGFAPALCNRLDRGTEGLVLAARSYPALREVNALLQDGSIQKHYLCVARGRPPEGLHAAYLAYDSAARKAGIFDAAHPGAKIVQTEVQVLACKGELTWCRVTLHTGRTHQIRAHLAHLGTPILGDVKYGGPDSANQYKKGCLALCAHQLAFSADLSAAPYSAYAGRVFEATGAELPAFWAGL